MIDNQTEERAIDRLTNRQQRFVREYLVDLNATQAAIRAGYSEKSAESKGAKLRAVPDIDEAITHELDWQRARVEVSADRVVKEANRLAFFDPRKCVNADGSPKGLHELDDDTAAAIASFEVIETRDANGNVTRRTKVKSCDKNPAVDRLMKVIGQLKDRVEHTGPNGGPIPISAVSNGDLDQRIAQLVHELGYAKAIDDASRAGIAAARKAETTS